MKRRAFLSSLLGALVAKPALRAAAPVPPLAFAFNARRILPLEIRIITSYDFKYNYTRFDILAAWPEQVEWNARLSAEIEAAERAPVRVIS